MPESQLPSEPNPPTAVPPDALWIVLFIVFLDLMGFGIILPQLPFYAIRYHVSPVQVTLIFSIFSICQFIAAPVLGLISDRHGRRPVLVFSQLGSAIGYIILGLVTQLNIANVAVAISLIYLARIIDGFSGGNISTAQAYISDVTTPERRATGMGLLGAAFGIGFAVGPFLGGIIGNDTNRASWPAFTAAAFSFAAMILSWIRLPESHSHRPVAEEIWLHPSRLVPILKRTVLFQLLMISFVAMAAFTMLEGIIGVYLYHKYTYGPQHKPYGIQQLGYYFGYLGFFIVVVQGGLMGRLTKRFGEWPVAITGAILVSIGMGVYVITGRMPLLSILLIAGAINAVGRSLQQPPIATLISKHSERSEQGAVFGLYHGLGSLARVVGPVTAGFVFEHVGMTSPFAVAGIVMLGVAIWLMGLRAIAPAQGNGRGFEVIAEASMETT
jgi:MFS transporter, DHA1 family, tetracycline resistance protein